MSNVLDVARLSALAEGSLGVFRGGDAVRHGVSRSQIGALVVSGALERVHPDTYRMTVVPRSSEQRLRAALLWAGAEAVAAGRSAGEVCKLEGVRAAVPEIIVPLRTRLRSATVLVHRSDARAAMMPRRCRGIAITGAEATLLSLAHALDREAFEIAFEDARRRRLTSPAALRAYIDRFGSGRAGVPVARGVLGEVDPAFASRSTLEVKTRRLLAAQGLRDYVREFPLTWKGTTYRYDFCFERSRTILETNGRRWHDDASDYERDNEKWSVPALCGYRIVFATWTKVTRQPAQLIDELKAAMEPLSSRESLPVVPRP
jgi:very-short-patch-repair endonuclease